MMRRDVENFSGYTVDGRWDGPAGAVLVEVKKTSSVRDVRDAFLGLAYALDPEDGRSRAVCVLVGSRLSEARLRRELEQFRAVIHPSIASRIHFLVESGEAGQNGVGFSGTLMHERADFYPWLSKLVAAETPADHGSPTPARQLVIAALAQLRFLNQAPVTVKYLQERCGVSYPTVAGVLKGLADKGWLEDSGKRGVRLRPLTTAEWMDLGTDLARQRKVFSFTDATGQSSPEQLFKRLVRLKEAGKLPGSVRVGGVMGASWHFPQLDITAAPRLDLSVEAEPAVLASMLDAGLQAKSKPEQHSVLAVHITRHPLAITDTTSESQGQWAGELECLADLIELGLRREALEMSHHMEQSNETNSKTA